MSQPTRKRRLTSPNLINNDDTSSASISYPSGLPTSAGFVLTHHAVGGNGTAAAFTNQSMFPVVPVLPVAAQLAAQHSAEASMMAAAAAAAANSAANSINLPGGEDLPCSICGDRATGKHYGAHSCDGCKGFFRRSIRKCTRYVCRNKSKSCVIDKEKRNQCRYCRLNKCYKAGMKQSAVQMERDKISNRISPFDDMEGSLISLNIALDAELRTRGAMDLERLRSTTPRMATKESVLESMQVQMRQLVLWAQTLPCYSTLSVDDRRNLLKSQAGELLILGALWRSYLCGHDEAILLANDTIITRNSQDAEVDKVASIIIDELLQPLRHLSLDEKEFAALKVIIMLDPNVKNISEECKRVVENCRHKMQVELMSYMNEKQYDPPGRFGALLLLLPSLRHANRLMLSLLNFSQALEEAKVDEMVANSSTGEDSLTEASGSRSYSAKPRMRSPMNQHIALQQPDTAAVHSSKRSRYSVLSNSDMMYSTDPVGAGDHTVANMVALSNNNNNSASQQCFDALAGAASSSMSASQEPSHRMAHYLPVLSDHGAYSMQYTQHSSLLAASTAQSHHLHPHPHPLFQQSHQQSGEGHTLHLEHPLHGLPVVSTLQSFMGSTGPSSSSAGPSAPHNIYYDLNPPGYGQEHHLLDTNVFGQSMLTMRSSAAGLDVTGSSSGVPNAASMSLANFHAISQFVSPAGHAFSDASYSAPLYAEFGYDSNSAVVGAQQIAEHQTLEGASKGTAVGLDPAAGDSVEELPFNVKRSASP